MNKHDVIIRVLLVDDDIVVRTTLSSLLAMNGFQVTTASGVQEALKLIVYESFEVLLSDLHMPGAGDGLTVISAMRHANPNTVTLLLSAFPQMGAAAQAILLQADEILTKPVDMATLIGVIRQRLAAGPAGRREILSVAEILARKNETTMQTWFDHVKKEERGSSVAMSYEQRCAHLPQFFRELISRLQTTQEIGGKQKLSPAAAAHGQRRRQQGYSATMLVEESRMLQVSIFQTLQSNLASIEFSQLPIGLMVIADEIDSQLGQAMAGYMECSVGDAHLLDRVGKGQTAAVNATNGGETVGAS